MGDAGASRKALGLVRLPVKENGRFVAPVREATYGRARARVRQSCPIELGWLPRAAAVQHFVDEGLVDDGVVEGPRAADAAAEDDVAQRVEPPPFSAMADDPRLAKYLRMLKMHLPRGAVEQKMRVDGMDPSLLDGASAAAPAAPEAPPAAPSGDPRLAKYERMLKMHLPRGAVEQKMRVDGLDPSLLGGGAAAAPAVPAPPPAAPAPSGDPRLAKYERMLKMHLPRGAVE